MSRKTCVRLFAALAVALSLWRPMEGFAEVKLPPLFSDHMILQREVPIVVWGWADPGEKVTATLAGQSQSTTADSAGKWKVQLAKLAAESEGLTLTVEGKSKISCNDVLVGDVWLISGQSNVGIPVSRAIGGAQDAAEADFPHLRFFTVPSTGALEPADALPGKGWDVCTPRTAANFSAVGFYFARTIHRDLQVPVGILNSSVGGTPIRCWVARDAQDTIAELKESTAARLQLMHDQAEDAKAFPERRAQWEKKYGVEPPENTGFAKGWAGTDFDDHGWRTAAMPSRWEQAAGVKTGGAFWLRKEVNLPPAAAGKPFALVLNFMHEQYDTTYFNGEEIGHTGDQPPLFYLDQRRYEVPGRSVRAGRNVIAIRVVSANPRLDLMGRGAHGDYNLPTDHKLVGNEWRVQVESLFPAVPPEALKSRPRPNDAVLYNTPTILYNAMIHPMRHYGFRGVLWYQGETDASHPEYYARLFPLLIEDWRKKFGQGELPFHFVQLPNYSTVAKDPNAPSGWATVREAQAGALNKVSNTGMAVTIDIGEGDNMHPLDKRDVGERLAKEVLANTYGRKIEGSGPRFQSMTVEGKAIRIHFTHADGLAARGGDPKWFAVAGVDRKFVWADARVDGESVVVTSPSLAEPVAVRYAWADNPEGCNLYNGAGLPAAPFRSDDWP